MKAAIHYLVKGKYIKCVNADDVEFGSFERVFEDENPIIARGKAFIYVKDYIDVFGESGWELHDRFIPVPADPIVENNNDIAIEDEAKTEEELLERIRQYSEQFENHHFSDVLNIQNGIGIYLIMNVPIPREGSNDHILFSEDYPIYGIDYNGNVFTPEEIIDGLTEEYDYYKYFTYDTNDYETQVLFWYTGEPYPELVDVLRTPFDWDELLGKLQSYESEQAPLTGDPDLRSEFDHKPVRSSLLKDNFLNEENLNRILDQGEGNSIEFKSTFFYNPPSADGLKGKAVIAKSINAFLNTSGGYLFIGINDKGIPTGLKNEFSKAGKKEPKDFIKLELDNMISHYLNNCIHEYIKAEFFRYNGQDVFWVTIEPSRYPVFMNYYDKKLFFIRATSSSRQLSDPEQLVNYCLNHKNFVLE